MGRRTLTFGKDVLLFFRGRDPDTLVSGDHKLRKAIREATIPIRSKIWPQKQQVTGYEVSFALLCRALRQAGMTVHINRHRLARDNPRYPVGVSGFPVILDDWRLPNPAVLGPGLYSHPKCNATLMDDRRFKAYLVKSSWMQEMFGAHYGADRVHTFFSGIDLTEWPATGATTRKKLDFIVYDKIRWNRDRLVPELLGPIVRELERRGLRYEILRYGRYNFETYRQRLAISNAMIFLCEHETQGMGWQEALASDLPIIAWDQGYWLDPIRPLYEPSPVPATSVPGFSEACGERFVYADCFPETLERFLQRRATYAPRQWVATTLSQARSARRYLQFYWAAGAECFQNDRSA